MEWLARLLTFFFLLMMCTLLGIVVYLVLQMSCLLVFLLEVAWGNRTRSWLTPEWAFAVHNSNSCEPFLWRMKTLTAPAASGAVCLHRDIKLLLADLRLWWWHVMDVCKTAERRTFQFLNSLTSGPASALGIFCPSHCFGQIRSTFFFFCLNKAIK